MNIQQARGVTVSDLDSSELKRYIFGKLQILALKQDLAMERTLKPFDVTTKQWFLHVMLLKFSDSPPTLKQLSNEMGTSYQNVKQVALRLEEKGLIQMYKDPKDARTTRVKLTHKSRIFWDQIEEPANLFADLFYEGVSDLELTITKQTIEKFLKNIEKIEQLNT